MRRVSLRRRCNGADAAEVPPPFFSQHRQFPSPGLFFTRLIRRSEMSERMSIAISQVEEAVTERYSRGAVAAEKGLCCPASYDPNLSQFIPKEVLERDYGCGN